jgi:hypothetical protein
MNDLTLAEAQQAREDRLLDEWLDSQMDVLLAHVGAAPGISEADTVGPDARHKLKGILQHYAKDPHPFTACVADNMKRFGPGRTERVCAVLKDIIRGTTKWRGHPELDHGAPGAIAASEVTIDDETERLLLSIPSDRLERFALEAQDWKGA